MTNLIYKNLFGTALLLGCTSVVHAVECTRADIDHYLDKGFTPTQIVALCGKANADHQTTTPTAVPVPATPAPAAPSAAATENMRDEIYLQSALDAEQVKLTDDALVLVQDRCLPYGDTDILDFKANACLVLETMIDWNGMEITKVVEPRVLVRDGEFLIKGNIRREITDPGKLRRAELEQFRADYPETASSINLPIKKGFSYEKTAAALRAIQHNRP